MEKIVERPQHMLMRVSVGIRKRFTSCVRNIRLNVEKILHTRYITLILEHQNLNVILFPFSNARR
jgi:hypothetical protein